MTGPKIEMSADHVYTVDGKIVPAISRVLETFGSPFAGVPPAILESAADFGTKFHKAVADYYRGIDHNFPEEIRPCVNAFLDWKMARPVAEKMIAVEKMVYSTALNIAGTLDFVGKSCADTFVRDWKTGAVGEMAFLQVAFYALAYESTTGDKVHFAEIVQFDRKSTRCRVYTLAGYDFTRAKLAVRGFCTAAVWKNEMKIKGELK